MESLVGYLGVSPTQALVEMNHTVVSLFVHPLIFQFYHSHVNCKVILNISYSNFLRVSSCSSNGGLI